MKHLPHILNLMGRIFISAIFLASGIHKILQIEGTKQYMMAHGIPFVTFFLLFAIIFEILGGLLVLLGCGSRIGALLLIIFLVPTTLIFHHTLSEQIQLMKNLAILGGLFFLLAHGSGTMGIDRFWKESQD